jgi:hypothetical protein
VILAIITHINGCVYYYVSETIGIGSDYWVYPATAGWRKNATSHVDDSVWEKWIYCTYWSAMVLTRLIEFSENSQVPVRDG